eukprot:TRINITY_DN6072_c0_g1_i4.p1 TRINITY_DN6072_c0_g1~~TRINITY_DN6072_c0_g1_i4.p1  ORF type:complete len:228 (+),score=64.95 TRINITY_DN6072_c0_g1_i4:57-686(+)
MGCLRRALVALVFAAAATAAGAGAAAEDGTCKASGEGCKAGARSPKEVLRQIEARCARKKSYCGQALGVAELYDMLKQCTTSDVAEASENTECINALQEILILSTCTNSEGKLVVHPAAKRAKCDELMRLLVYAEPLDGKVVQTLAAVQWLAVFVKRVEGEAVREGYDNGTYYMQPSRIVKDEAEYGKIAFHRVTEGEFLTNHFAGVQT